MRKWMRDRLKRPKKNAEAGKSEPAQAPLQPAYYDAADASRRRLQSSIKPNEAEFNRPRRNLQHSRRRLGRRARRQPQRPGRKWTTRAADGGGDRGGRGRGGTQGARTRPSPRHHPKWWPRVNRRRCCNRNRGRRESDAGSRAPGFQRHGGSCHRIAGIRQEFMVQAAQHHAAFERHAARASV